MGRTIIGDCRDSMRQLIADGVKLQTCVTSPPYYGLRDYSACGCSQQRHASASALEMCRTIVPGASGQSSATDPRCQKEPDPDCPMCQGTGKIAGTENQLGLEPTPDEYVANMVEVFRLVRELLKDDGTLWLNLGDSYCGSTSETPSKRDDSPIAAGTVESQEKRAGRGDRTRAMMNGGLKPKDLIGIPWRVAFALQADGWYLRQDIIWAKPNPMPESVRDRCTKSHEYLFLLSKNARYYYDADAIREAEKPNSGMNMRAPKLGDHRADGNYDTVTAKTYECVKGANRRSVWTVPTTPYKGAHFATFPPDLIKPCILAGSRAGDVVLDPFFGSGTTGQVASDLGRDWIGLELNPAYVKLQEQRTAQQGLEL